MNIAILGIIGDGPVELGSNSGNETNIVTNVVKKIRIKPKTAWIQELEEEPKHSRKQC